MNTDIDIERRRKSAIFVAEIAVLNREVLHVPHLNELLSVAAWMYTEAEGKYSTRYATTASLDVDAKLRHEHVIPRRALREAMLAAPHCVAKILGLAVACTVTESEHRTLGSGFGWHRYEVAGIEVVERQSRRRVEVSVLAQELDSAWASAIAS
jgi:hypothetical protein